MPGKVMLRGGVSSKIFSLSETATGELQLRNETDNVTLVRANPTTIYDAGGVALSSHGSRHSRGAADPLDYSLVMKMLLKSVSPSIGTGGTLGSAVSVSPDTGYSRIVPLGIRITIGGTLATGETITVRVTFVRDDGTSAYVDKSFTATGNYYLSEDDFISLWKNLVGLSRIDVQAATSATSTSATVTVTVRGVQH